MFKRIRKNIKNESKKLFNKSFFSKKNINENLKKNQIHLNGSVLPTPQVPPSEKMETINFKEIKLDHAWYQDFLIYMIHLLRPESYCELGIAEGHVFKRIAPLVKKSYGVDIREECGLSIKDLPNSTFFCGSTTNFAKSLKAKGEKIDFLFIDADHSKKAVAEDFYNFFDLITPHGMIVFHDTHPANQEMTSSGRCGDCYDIILQLQKDNLIDCEMMTIPLHPGLTLCRKRKKQLKWHETDSLELYFDTKQSLDDHLKKITLECNSLLDIGCGINPSDLVVPKIFHIFLEPFDQYSKVLDYRIRNYKKSFIVKQDGINFLKSLSNSSIDTIIMFDVIEHMEKEDGHELLKEAMRVCNKQIILSTPLGFLAQDPEGKDAWNLDGIEPQTHKSGWEPKDFPDNWKFLICKKYWEHNVGNKIVVVPTFYALFNKLGEKSFNEERIFFDRVPDYFKREFNLS